jgi:hypothetical protein
MSLAILKHDMATVLMAPWEMTIASWAASASNLLGAVTNGSPVIAGDHAATFSAKPAGEARPVPTAVPPWASSSGRAGSFRCRRMRVFDLLGVSAENSWPSVSGVASWVWVRPILMMSAQAFALASRALMQVFERREQGWTTSSAQATCMAVGIGVVGRLGHVDVIVGVDRLLRAHLAAEHLDGAVGNDLVGIHVGLGARSCLPDDEREVIVMLAVDDLLRGGNDGLADLWIHLAERDVGLRRPA